MEKDTSFMNDLMTKQEEKKQDKDEATTIVSEAPKRKIIYVGLRFRVDQVADINTVDQTYHALCSLDMDWDATPEDVEAHTKDPRTYTPVKVPRIDPKNIVAKNVSYKPWANGNLNKLVEKDGKYYNLRRIEYDAVWSEPFEVMNFPFDVQDLTFVFQSRSFNKVDKRVFVPSRLFGDFFRVEKTYLSVADWDLVICDAFIQKIDWIKAVSKGAKKDETGTRTVPRMNFRVQVRRIAKPILVRVVFWMFLLGLLAFGIFSIAPEDIGDRLSYATTLVLAVVAFQFVNASIIPNVPYLTIIDKYNLLILGFVILVTLESIAVGWYKNDDYFSDELLESIDQICLIVMFSLFILSHLWFLAVARKAMQYEETKLGQTKQQLDKMFEKAGYHNNDVEQGPVEIMTFTRDEFLNSKNNYSEL